MDMFITRIAYILRSPQTYGQPMEPDVVAEQPPVQAAEINEGSVCAENGKFYQHPLTCRKFLRCDHGRFASFDCPQGTVFVLSLSVCDHERNHQPCQ